MNEKVECMVEIKIAHIIIVRMPKGNRQREI
jgi:hypothetical protein